MKQHITIRTGKQTDVEAALELINELAEYERSPDEVEVSVNEMIQNGFGQHPLYYFFVLEKECKVIGLALYYFKYSTWKGKCLFLEDIIITANERRNGYGKLLFNEVVKVARELKVRRMEWQVLNWNTPAIKFYEKYHSNFDGEWINCKLSYQQLQSE